jgi:uncharacterized protein with FMN-binding domain
MRRIVVGLMATVSGLVMLFSYHTSTGGGTVASRSKTSAGLGNLTGAGATGSGSGSASASGSGSTSGGTGSTGSSGSDGTIYQGDVADTRWGPVQVGIKVVAGKIVAADAIQYPTGNSRDDEINSYAVPVLNQEVVTAQSANIDMISGATVTSDGYIRSLQSALDAAHL